MPAIIRCPWAIEHPLNTIYHDQEWGRAMHDDGALFEFLILEGMQAGLSWLTVLKKREHYRKVLLDFNAEKIARFTPAKQLRLLNDPGIIRNRLKVASIVQNAKAFLKIQAEFGSFNHYIWQFVNNKPLINRWKSQSDIPAKTIVSDDMSKALKKRGFNFVGSTICYSFMQAVGMVDDHVESCFRCRK